MQEICLQHFRIYLLDTIKKNIELRKTLQVQSKSKHQKKLAKVEKSEDKDEDEDEVEDEDELTYF